MISYDESGAALYIHTFEHSVERMKSLFLVLETGFLRLGLKPNRLGVTRRGVKRSGKYVAYKRLRPKLDEESFADVESFVIECLPEGRSDQDYRSWRSQASVSRQSRDSLIPSQLRIWEENWNNPCAINSRWYGNWTVFPQDAEIADELVIEEMIRIAAVSIDEYGYIAWLRRGTEPPAFDMMLGVPGDHGSHSWSHRRDQIMNRMTWVRFGCWTRRLLRDVYPVNFLGRPYLDLQIDGGTLEEWILADPLRRGTLEPLNGRMWVWRPAIRWLAFIREPLFRAGLLHWWQMFCVDDYTQLQVMERFSPPHETPEMFRPEYYDGRDPRVTG